MTKIIFIGIQGSGKSTQAKLLSKKLQMPYIEMGQLFRNKSQEKNQTAMKIREALQVGRLVPDEIATQTLHERINQPDCQSGYILDGYPRNLAQLKELPQDIDKVFYIHIPDKEGIKRLLARRRTDDTLEIIQKRIEIFHKDTEPLLKYFRQKSILQEIDGTQNVQKVHKDVQKKFKMRSTTIKSEQELQIMKTSGRICAFALKKVLDHLKEGITTIELDRIADLEIRKHQAQSSFKTVEDYQWTICTTVNNQVVHGIPTEIILKNGDIVGVDIGALHKGFHSDMAITVPVGEIPEATRQFLQTGRVALKEAIFKAKIGNRIGDISATIQRIIEHAGFSIVKELTGHGIGRKLHEEPFVPGFGKEGTGSKILKNMVLAIEVIYAMGSGQIKLESDKWTISTQDDSLGALFEQTVAITENGPIVLTPYL